MPVKSAIKPAKLTNKPSNAVIDYDAITAGGDAPKEIKKAFARLGNHVVNVETTGKARRTAGVSYKELSMYFADNQQVMLRVKSTGDIYQVLVNDKELPIKNQDDFTRAIAEIDQVLNKGRVAFQKKLAKAAVETPKSIRTATPNQEKILTEKRDALKEAIQAVEDEIKMVLVDEDDATSMDLTEKSAVREYLSQISQASSGDFLNYPEKKLYEIEIPKDSEIIECRVVTENNRYDGIAFAVMDDSESTERNLMLHVSLGEIKKDFEGINRFKEARIFIQKKWDALRESLFPSGVHVVGNKIYLGKMYIAGAVKRRGGKITWHISNSHLNKFDIPENAARVFENDEAVVSFLLGCLKH